MDFMASIHDLRRLCGHPAALPGEVLRLAKAGPMPAAAVHRAYLHRVFGPAIGLDLVDPGELVSGEVPVAYDEEVLPQGQGILQHPAG